MPDYVPLDREHLLTHALEIFPGAAINLVYAPDEIIHLDVDGHRFTFEIGSDDNVYAFTDGEKTFTIPLIDIEQDF